MWFYRKTLTDGPRVWMSLRQHSVVFRPQHHCSQNSICKTLSGISGLSRNEQEWYGVIFHSRRFRVGSQSNWSCPWSCGWIPFFQKEGHYGRTAHGRLWLGRHLNSAITTGLSSACMSRPTNTWPCQTKWYKGHVEWYDWDPPIIFRGPIISDYLEPSD